MDIYKKRIVEREVTMEIELSFEAVKELRDYLTEILELVRN